ncbi:MAG: hypothetical protein AAB336_06060 [Acidobacteriota bacterium]
MKRTIFSLSLILSIACQIFAQNSVTIAIREYRQSNEHQLLQDFVQMLSIPNVASDTPNIRKNADYLVE